LKKPGYFDQIRSQKRAQEHSIRGQKDPPKSGVKKDPPKSGVKKTLQRSIKGSKKTLKSSIRGQKRPSKAQSGVKKDPPKAGFSSIPKKGAPENPKKGGSFSLFHKGIAIPGQKTPLPCKFCQNRPSQDLAGPPKKEAQGVQDPLNPRNCSRKSIQEVNQDLRGAKDPDWLSRKGPIGPLNILILKVAKFL